MSMEKGKIPSLKRATGKIIRVAETNLDGAKKVKIAIRGVRGVGMMMSNAVSHATGFGDKLLEELTEDELKKLTDIIQKPEQFGVPTWMLNRRHDPIRGTDRHLVASTLQFTQKMDINEMKKIKTYRGIRHSQNLPVRGQRTRGSFRKGKAVGVSRQKAKPGGKK